MTLAPCKLASIGPNGSFTDADGNVYGAPSTGADWGAGTAPTISGTIVASVNTVAYFDFG